MTKEQRKIFNLINSKTEEAKVLNEQGKVEEAKAIVNEIKTLRTQLENLVEIEDAERLEIEDKGMILPKESEKKVVDFVGHFVNFIKTGKISDEMKESVDADGGLIVPQDISTKINEKKRALNSLKKYIRVEKVNTLSGSRVFEKNADNVPFASVEEGGVFQEVATPQFEKVDYKVVKYGGIISMTRELLKDTTENIKKYLIDWIAKKEVATENKAILTVVDATYTTAVAIKSYDDIKTILNTKIDPALLPQTVILTNQTGYNWLDTLKDKNDRYILKDHITDPNVTAVEGKYPVIVVTDSTLPVKAKKVPFYIGALEEAVTHFEREGRTIETNEVGDAFWTKDRVGIKARMRFDTKAVDKEAVVKGEFTQGA